jgi:hypothetical protein
VDEAGITVSMAPFGQTMWLTGDAGQGFAFAPLK